VIILSLFKAIQYQGYNYIQNNPMAYKYPGYNK
jgi:hypothetical protein